MKLLAFNINKILKLFLEIIKNMINQEIMQNLKLGKNFKKYYRNEAYNSKNHTN